MQQLQWARALPEQTLEGGLKLLQELQWNLTLRESEGVWFVSGGHRSLLKHPLVNLWTHFFMVWLWHIQ